MIRRDAPRSLILGNGGHKDMLGYCWAKRLLSQQAKNKKAATP